MSRTKFLRSREEGRREGWLPARVVAQRSAAPVAERVVEREMGDSGRVGIICTTKSGDREPPHQTLFFFLFLRRRI